jgi:hypothetical protein
MYSPVVVSVFIVFVSVVDLATNERLSLGQLFCAFVRLPERELIILGIAADDEIAHLRHRRFAHADFAAKFLDLAAAVSTDGTAT